jgi:hypothetical protein
MDVADGFAIKDQTVSVSNVDPALNYIGFQADMIFDSAVAAPTPGAYNSFVAATGLTGGSPAWTIGSNIINSGPGTFKTLRVSAFVSDGQTALNGSGPIYVIHWRRVSATPGQNTALTWAPQASGNDFVFCDTDLNFWSASPQNNGMIIITAPGAVSISGNVNYCSNPTLPAVPGVTMTLTGNPSGSTSSDTSGNYAFGSLVPGSSYTVTPSKTALPPASPGINVMDLLAVQRHFLNLTLIPPGCRLTAADVNGDGNVNNIDITAILRFYLGLTNGIANVGHYNFSPASQSYPAISGNQINQNYAALVFGDVVSGFVDRPGEQSPEMADRNQLPKTVATVALPALRLDQSRSNFTAEVTTSAIDGRNNLVGFQGDLTFDERVIRFEDDPVQKAGLTNGNWIVAGNVLPGAGPIRTLRVAAYSTDFNPLSSEGILFELRILDVTKGLENAPLTWAVPPNEFIFIDANLNVQRPGY